MYFKMLHQSLLLISNTNMIRFVTGISKLLTTMKLLARITIELCSFYKLYAYFKNSGKTGTHETQSSSENERNKLKKFVSAVLLRPSVIPPHSPSRYMDVSKYSVRIKRTSQEP